MRIYIASANPTKVNGTREAFRLACPHETVLDVVPVRVASGVSEQPIGFAETAKGAAHRLEVLLADPARHANQTHAAFISIEAGVEDVGGRLWLFQFAHVLFNGHYGMGRSSSYVVPPRVAALIRGGMTHADADLAAFGPPPVNDEDGYEDGTVYRITAGATSRLELVQQAVLLALAPGLRPELYADP